MTTYAIPYDKMIRINYYDTDTFQFQLTENGTPVSENLETQTIKFHLRGAGSFTPIMKNIFTEGWIVNNTTKIIKMVIDTEVYLMLPANTASGQYYGRLEWVDRKVILVTFTVEVRPQTLWSL